MTDVPMTHVPAEQGRSLWADAWARLKANRAALWSAWYLVFMALLCVFGPWFTPHEFTTIYQDYNRVPPSFSSYPKPEMIDLAVKDAVQRSRVQLAGWEEKDGKILITITSAKPIDERMTRYIDRSSVFEGTQVVSKSADSLKLVMSTSVEKQYFYFGTDNSGRDMLTRTLMAGRVSLAIGLLAGLVAVVIGVLYGATAGFTGGKTDEVMMRIVDVLYALPFIFFVIMLVVFFGRNFVLMFLAVGAVLWLDMARIVRGQALSIREREYITAAESIGCSTWRIVWHHLFPGVLPLWLVGVSGGMAAIALTEVGLSFLGLGIEPPTPSFGGLIYDGTGIRQFERHAHLLIFSATPVILFSYAWNMLGDALVDIVQPKQQRS